MIEKTEQQWHILPPILIRHLILEIQRQKSLGKDETALREFNAVCTRLKNNHCPQKNSGINDLSCGQCPFAQQDQRQYDRLFKDMNFQEIPQIPSKHQRLMAVAIGVAQGRICVTVNSIR